MVKLEKIKAVGKEDAQDALTHFFQMKPQKSVSEEWKKKEFFNMNYGINRRDIPPNILYL